MNSLISKIKSEEANSLVENVIVLPLIFIVIYSIIIMSFVTHDKGTMEAAAKHGAIYASHCISDPNFANVLAGSGSEKGTLDTTINAAKGDKFSFSGLGKNIEPYRYITGGTNKINSQVEDEVRAIVDNTRIHWRDIEVDDIKYTCVNKIFYQDVTVTVEASYPIPKFFEIIGLGSELEYSVTAKMTVNDPDEFIRNADMVVDLITDIDNSTGGNLKKVTDKISQLATKLLDWFEI